LQVFERRLERVSRVDQNVLKLSSTASDIPEENLLTMDVRQRFPILMFEDCLQNKYMSKYLKQNTQETFRLEEQHGMDSFNQGSYGSTH
jgi:hypothetical protein